MALKFSNKWCSNRLFTMSGHATVKYPVCSSTKIFTINT